MIGGFFRKSGKSLPCVVHITIARYSPALPKPGETLKFLISIHVEGSGVTWQRNVTVDRETENRLLDLTEALYQWSLNAQLTRETARACARELGGLLYQQFIGERGRTILEGLHPTAILLDVDETIQNLPWELIGPGGNPLSLEIPFGRLVSTREILRPNRDPLSEDSCLRILAMADTSGDLASGQRELDVLNALEGERLGFRIKVDVLAAESATLAEFRRRIAPGTYDILHFSGHGSFDRQAPQRSGLKFYDGLLTADEILKLEWTAPPYFVFTSACESGRTSGGRRLVSRKKHSSGLAAAFIAAGASACAGYYWPVSDTGAGIFCEMFYNNLFERENVGLAFQEARRRTLWELEETGDLTGNSAILFGDAASSDRRDLYTMSK